MRRGVAATGFTSTDVFTSHEGRGEMNGRIFQLNCSDGGVPKLAVREARVTPTGLECDRPAHPKFHGGPERALCLFSLEKIMELQAEGHPIFPGSVGENVTVAGLRWATLAPGTRLALGEEVLIEITKYTTPCNTIAASFAERDFRRIDQKLSPGDSRLYARILQTGVIKVGQDVKLLHGVSPTSTS